MNKKIKLTLKQGESKEIAQEIAFGELGVSAVEVEGNYYFDTSAVNMQILKIKAEGKQYTCPVKRGTCDYYNLIDPKTGEVLIDEVGWIYPIVENPNFKQIEGKIAFYLSRFNVEVV
jgi:uncharacterized protein (DUF427 family)